jgi:hypothetical protein
VHYTPEISNVTADMLIDNTGNPMARRLLIIMIDGLKN